MSEVKSVFSLADLGIRMTDERLVVTGVGEDFGGGQLIAPFKAAKMHKFMSMMSFAECNTDEQIPLPDLPIQRSGGEWHVYYYYSYADAKTAWDTSLGDDSRDNNFKKPEDVWVIWTETENILNANETLIERSGAVFTREVRVQSLRVGHKPREGKTAYPLNNRHEWNFITQPCMIAAVADIMGIENTGYDVEDLVADGVDHTEEKFVQLCGDVYGQYEDADLFTRRAKLWQSLGEDDGRKDLPTGSRTAKGKPHKLATDSPMLSECLSVVCGIWDKPLWIRLAMIPNPRPEAVNDETDRQFTVPAIVEFFHTEADARAAAAELVEENGGAVAPAHPPMPKNWVNEKPERLVAYLKDEYFVKPENASKPLAVQATETSMDSVEQLVEWKTYAGIG